MNSSGEPFRRRIASNLLWTPQGVIRHPLVTFHAGGGFLVETCPAPDRLAATEFHAGLLVADFPTDYRTAFDRLKAAGGDLATLLPQTVTENGVWVVISALDYAALRLLPQSQIRLL